VDVGGWRDDLRRGVLYCAGHTPQMTLHTLRTERA
jgi:hypothetical protein